MRPPHQQPQYHHDWCDGAYAPKRSPRNRTVRVANAPRSDLPVGRGCHPDRCAWFVMMMGVPVVVR